MKHGDQKRIADYLGKNKMVICRYFNGGSVSKLNRLLIENAIQKLGIELDKDLKAKNILNDRWDICNNLTIHDISNIAKETNTTYQIVWKILHGDTKDNYGVIKISELYAAINIWKTRFCKYESEL